MKRKLDFVTNSSSTSFVGFGTSLDMDDLRNNDVLARKLYNKYISDGNGEGLTFETFKKENFEDEVYEIDDKFLEFHRTDYDIYVFASIKKMKDDETLGQFKAKIVETLKEFGITIKTPEYIEECYYDG